MDRTTELAGRVREALGSIADSWLPDDVELVEVNNLVTKLRFLWAGGTVTYQVTISRLGED